MSENMELVSIENMITLELKLSFLKGT